MIGRQGIYTYDETSAGERAYNGSLGASSLKLKTFEFFYMASVIPGQGNGRILVKSRFYSRSIICCLIFVSPAQRAPRS